LLGAEAVDEPRHARASGLTLMTSLAATVESPPSAGFALSHKPVRLPSPSRPTLFVVIDTEEEFDWNAPFDRRHTQVSAMRHIKAGHRILRRYGITPTYVVDYPVAVQMTGVQSLRELVDAGECTIGAHLHPWVTPPHTETVDRHNSFACNLGWALEREKLRTLTAVIERHLRVQPKIYKAGRYGFGPSSARIIEDLGFEVDVSVQPSMNYKSEGGPSFASFAAAPFWFGSLKLLEIPCTTGYTGVARAAGRWVGAWSERLTALRVPGVLARLGILNKVGLSPEGYTLKEQKDLTHALLGAGIRTFCLTFHSPSLEPGHTPYVRTQHELDEFLGRIDAYCQFFFGQLGGTTTTPLEFRKALLAVSGAAAVPAA